MSRNDKSSDHDAPAPDDPPVERRRRMRGGPSGDEDGAAGSDPVPAPRRLSLADWRASQADHARADPSPSGDPAGRPDQSAPARRPLADWQAAAEALASDPAAPANPAPANAAPAADPPLADPARAKPAPADAAPHESGRDPPPPTPSGPTPALGRTTGVLAAGTFLSRISGFARVVVAGAVLGLNGLGDAYNIANTIPNIVYDLLLGGILSATLIPVFVDELRREDSRERDRAVSAILTAAAGVLLVLSLFLYVLAPVVIHLYLALNHQGSKVAEVGVGVSLLRLFAPQVLLLGAIVVSTALLNARRQFAAAAFSPIVNNIIAIAALVVTDLVAHNLNLAVFGHNHRGLLVLGLGTTLGYLAQFLVQVPALVRTGLRIRPVWAPRHPAVRRLVGLSAWLLGVVIANQVSYNLIVIIAVKKKGDYTAYLTAYQFFQLPYALFAVSIASAIMPDLADRWAAQQWTAFLARVISGLRVTLALLVPAAVGYAFVAMPVVLLAYRHGHVTYADARLVSQTLAVFALGLPGFSAFLPLVRALQAMKDTRTMFAVYALENALTIVFALVLYKRFGDRGLAVAFVGPYTIAAIVTAHYLHRKVGALGGVYTARSIVRTVVATATMALMLFGVGQILPAGLTYPVLVLHLVVEVGVGAAVYLLVAHWLEIDDLQPLLRPAVAALRRAGLARPSHD